MKAEAGNGNHQQGVLHRLLPAVLPVLLISIGYVDPGKWVITVEGGSRFGLDLVAPMLLFNLAAILCQYLSARIGVVTGRNLAQICCDEYEKSTRIFLGVQAELSVIVLDLTMVLGVAHGINLLFGVDLSTGVLLAALDAILFPVFASLLDHCRASFLCMYAAGFVLLSYAFGVLISQPEISLSMTGMLTRLSGESAFALMSLLGASIMPHNFYLHSSIVQQHQRPPFISTSTLCHDHFFAIICVFSGLFLVNYVLMNAASNVFYNAGLILVTFQDAMSLIDQAFRNGVLAIIFMLVMFLSNQITASTWNLGGQVVLHDFLGLHIPGWLHRATIRNIASIPALYCVWTSGAEGIYQLLIFTQVMIALLLPSSVIPLFRISSSRPIMGVYKMSPIMEFLALVTFMGMLGLKIVFVVEMIFGSSDWVGSLKSSAGIDLSFPFVVLLVTAGASFSLMLWLAATPLKSASFRNEAHALNWDLDRTVSVPEAAIEREENDSTETRYHEDEPACIEERSSIPENSIESQFDLSSPNYDLDLPETILESDQEILLNTVNDNPSAVGWTNYETSMYANAGSRSGVPLAFDELSQSKGYRDAFLLQLSSSAGSGSLWSRQPFELFGVAEIKRTAGSEARGSGLNSTTRDTAFGIDLESKLLLSFRHCIVKLLKLDGSDWLFRQNDGADEDLIDRVAAREKFLYDAEIRQINQAVHSGEPQYLSSERRYGSTLKSDEVNLPNVLISSVPNCGEGCIWKVDLIISFGVWCIHRILDLLLMESRPELWGKYTYVLNRLQGVIDLAFSKPRSPMSTCFCLEIPAEYQQKSSSPVSNGLLPPTAKPGRGKCTNATMLLDIIKDVELAISCRKGRSGTAAGDVAFPKGKENLAPVLKRYKRRLSNLVRCT